MNYRLEKSLREIALQGLFKKKDAKKVQYFIFSSLFPPKSNNLASTLRFIKWCASHNLKDKEGKLIQGKYISYKKKSNKMQPCIKIYFMFI